MRARIRISWLLRLGSALTMTFTGLKRAGGVETQGVTLATLVPRGWKRLKRHATMWVLGQSWLAPVIRSANGGQQSGPYPSLLIEALNFIHFGRWVVIAKPWWKLGEQGLPHLGPPQPRETMDYSLILFISNFNNDWRPYVDSFMDASEDDLGVMWADTPGWPAPKDVGWERFFAFVQKHVVPSSHYYSAYPDLATTDVKAALTVDRHVRAFVSFGESLPQGQSGNEAWCVAYDRLVTRLQRHLGYLDPTVAPDDRALGAEGGAHDSLTSLAPLPHWEADALRNTIATVLPAVSPFADVAGTHYARLAVISEVTDTELAAGSRPLSSAYLLMSADGDGSVSDDDDWLGALYEAFTTSGIGIGVIDDIWGRCYHFPANPSKQQFIDYLKRTILPPTIDFADYPYVSLSDVDRAVRTHATFTAFVFSHLDAKCADKRVAFGLDVAGTIPERGPGGGP